MKALTLLRPWAWLVASGQKTIETRTMRTTHRGELAIHSGLQLDRDIRSYLVHELGLTIPDHGGAEGAIVAVANVVDCRELRMADRGELKAAVSHRLTDAALASLLDRGRLDLEHRYGWFLADVRSLMRPVVTRGYQGLWPVPAAIESEVRAALPDPRQPSLPF